MQNCRQSNGGAVSLADLLELRSHGLTEPETWALLCQAVQALQDLFLSDSCGVGRCVPLVTPGSFLVTSRGRVSLPTQRRLTATPPQTAYLAPEYRPTKNYTDTESEKMWIFSLGETLTRTALTSHCAVTHLSPALCRALSAMTRHNPLQRANLMCLLDVISDYCKSRVQTKPFSHIVMDLHREVMAPIYTPWTTPVSRSDWPPAGTLPRHQYTTYNRSSKSPYEPRPKPHYSEYTPQNTLINQLNKFNDRTEEMNRNTLARFSQNQPLEPEKRRKPIQRAASRLYKATPNSHRQGCIGPEFVVRSSLPSKQLEIGVSKSRKVITVILLTGQKVQVHCDPNTTTAGEIFEGVIQSEGLTENFMLGLSALMTGDFIFLPPDTRISKIVTDNLTLFLRVRLFLPSLRGLRGYEARHALYLQLRRSVLEQHVSSLKSLVTLGGLALQAEFGDFSEQEHGKTEYFLLEHYVPETMLTETSGVALREVLSKAHQARGGTDRDRAEQEFIQHAQSLPHYGGHFYAAVWVQKENHSNVWICVTARGITLYERSSGPLSSNISPCQSFEWRFIQTLCYSKQYLCILPQSKGSNKRPPKCKLKMDHKKSYFTFRLASLHHQFFLRLRTEYSSLQTLAQEFGIPLKTMKNESNALISTSPRTRPKCRRSRSANDVRKIPLEEYQNKENENLFGSSLCRENKRQGVLMGTRAIGNLYESRIGEAYVLNSTLKPSELIPDFQETISDSLMDKFDKLSFTEERLLRSVTLHRNQIGSLGLQITEGSDGNVYVQSIIPHTPAEQSRCIHPGDQIIAVNGHSLLNMRYVNALNLLKQTGTVVEFVLSQSSQGRSRDSMICSLIDRTMVPDPIDVSQINYVDFSEELTRSSLYSYKLSRRGGSKSCGMLTDPQLYRSKVSKSLEEFLDRNTDSEYLDDTLSLEGEVAVPRCLGLSRKWKGPVRYPVTPARHGFRRNNSLGTSEDDTATYTVTSDEEQIFI